jgi:hypothetical protein
MDEKGVQTQYLAPQIDPQALPIQDIGNSIRRLYEAPFFTKDGPAYIFQPADSPMVYRLEHITGTAACAYPRTISLFFKSEDYRLDIAVESFTCS